jgi:hypothetical protein
MFQRGWLWLRDQGETELTLFGEGDFNRGLQFADDMGWSFCIKVQDGQSETNQGVAQLIRTRRQSLGLRPMPLMGWSTNRDNPVADAQKTNGLIYREGLQGFVNECEEYKSLDITSERWKRTGRFVDEAYKIENGNSILKRYMEAGNWGFCYLPNEAAGPYIDWRSVQRGKGRGLPECYPNEFPGEPSQWPEEAVELASKPSNPLFPKSYMHPVVGLHESRFPIDAWQYTEDLWASKRNGFFTWGFGVYGIQDMTAADRRALKAVTAPVALKSKDNLVLY